MTALGVRPVAVEPVLEPATHESALQDFRDRRARQLMTLIGVWVVLPRLIQTVLAPKYRFQVGVQSVAYVPLASYTQRILFYSMLGFCLWIIAESFRNPPKGRGLALLVFLAPSLYLATRDIYLVQSFQNTRYLYPMVVIAIWALRPRIRSLATLGVLVGVTITLCVLLGVVLPAKAVFHNASGEEISQDKQILPFGILIGVFTQGNNLGQFIALGLPSMALIRHRRARLCFFAVAAFAILWCASRSAVLSVGLSIVAALVTLACTRPSSRRTIGFLAAIVPFGLVCVLPLITHDPGAFTNRGYIWQQSLLEFDTSKLLGLGASFYSIIGASSATLGPTVFHGHNEFVQLLVTGGVVLVLLVGALIALGAVSASALAVRGSVFGVAWLAAFAGACVLEVSLVLVDNDILFPVMVVPLAVIVFSADLTRTPIPAPVATGGPSRREQTKYLRTKGPR